MYGMIRNKAVVGIINQKSLSEILQRQGITKDNMQSVGIYRIDDATSYSDEYERFPEMFVIKSTHYDISKINTDNVIYMHHSYIENSNIKRIAIQRVSEYSESTARTKIVSGTGSLQREGWLIKMLITLLVMPADSPLRAELTASLNAVIAKEAELRGRNETNDQMLENWVNKFSELAFATAVIDGMSNTTEDMINSETTENSDVISMLMAAEQNASQALSELLESNV